MNSIYDLIKKFKKWQKEIDNQVIEAQRKTAEVVWEDIIANAPVKSGEYISSIQIEDTKKEGHTITTLIGSDLKVGPTKWGPSADPFNKDKGLSNNAPAGTEYCLGYLLEHGTLPHAIPNAFGRGFYWGSNGKKGTLDPNWHVGTIAQPHYAPAVEKNRKLYKDNIRVVWRTK